MTEHSPDDLTRLVRTKITVCGCGCWVWTGSTDTSGYGKVKMRNRTLIIHRYVYEHFVGSLPTTDDTIDHLCDRHRTCVNPDHFEVVTRSVNSTRANDRRWHSDSPDRSNCTVLIPTDNQQQQGETS